METSDSLKRKADALNENEQDNFQEEKKQKQISLFDYLLDKEWKELLHNEFRKLSFQYLESFIEKQEEAFQVYPKKELIFNVFNLCPPSKVKVLVVAQDPFFNENQAMGVAFGVQRGVKIPPSLSNIFKELENEYPTFKRPDHGDLTSWVQQGVFLLNAVLTVNKGSPNSHQGKGWEQFTDEVIRIIAKKNPFIVVLLWGAYAQKKAPVIKSVNPKHLILTTTHPSPFSYDKGFCNCKHFSKANAELKKHGMKEIDWNLPE